MRAARGTQDKETRARLRAAALRLFAERGFNNVTVRDISSEARANLAAVSYHYRDKLGLYEEVVGEAIAAMRTVNDETMDTSHAKSPEDKLRHYVRTYLPRLVEPEAHGWIQKLMRHEMSDPTPLAKKIASEAILPRVRFLEGVVAEMLECEPGDPRVRYCVMSVQAQCLHQMKTPFRNLVLKTWYEGATFDLERAAEHVAEFSIAGIKALKARKPPRP